jgi:hypothetical protein
MKQIDDRDKQEALHNAIQKTQGGLSPKYRDITEQEWNEYEWVEVNDIELGRVFLQGRKRTQPPQDGYKYIDVTKLGDSEQKWERAKTIDRKSI